MSDAGVRGGSGAGRIRETTSRGKRAVEYVLAGGAVVSSLELLDLRLYFEGESLPAAGIASVFTVEEHRGKGYARACIAHALLRAREGGTPVSLLFGIRDFYEQFGYVSVMPWYQIELPVPRTDHLASEPATVPFQHHHAPEANSLYTAAAQWRIGPAVRNDPTAGAPSVQTRWRQHAEGRVLLDRAGTVRGYLWQSPSGSDDYTVAEALAADNETYRDIVSYLGHEASRRQQTTIGVALPPDDPFALRLREHDARFTEAPLRSGGGMITVLAWPQFFPVLGAAVKRRARLLRPEVVPRTLTLSCESGSGVVMLGGRAGEAHVQGRAGVLTRLLFGRCSLREARWMGAICVGLEGAGELLFPRCAPFMYLRDRF